MSGAAGGTRIPRSAVNQTIKDYTDRILSKIPGFTSAKLSGSVNRLEKEDFGDIDLIVTIATDKDKKTVKQEIAKLFQSLPDTVLPPLNNEKYKGKKVINHGEIITNLYPISGITGEFIQIDNIIALTEEESTFKQTVLDFPAEIQGLILGLVKVPLLEEDPEKVFNRMGIKGIPEVGQGQEYEFHLDTSNLTLRLVTYGENYNILDSSTVWKSSNFSDVKKLLSNFNLEAGFGNIIKQIKQLKNPRSKNRIKGFFKKSITVGAAEKGTPKGETKEKALNTVASLQEGLRAAAKNQLRAEYIKEDEKKKIAVFPGAFKPPHKDHVSRIKAAAEEVGEDGDVLIIIAPKDRIVENQEPISAKQSLSVFNMYKQKGVLPSNVHFQIAKNPSPILDAYKIFETNPDNRYIAVFGKDDSKRWGGLSKLANTTASSFEEANIGNISASDLRTALKEKNNDIVRQFLPEGILLEDFYNALGLLPTFKAIEEAEQLQSYWIGEEDKLRLLEQHPELFSSFVKHLSGEKRKSLKKYYIARQQQPVEKKNLNENATYSKDIDFKSRIAELTDFMRKKGYTIDPLPKVVFLHQNIENAQNFLGKTAYYDPNDQTITLYTEGRHPKDIVRSFAHEMIHHIQNLKGELGDVNTTNTQEDDNLNNLEKEANLEGATVFRNWTDSLNEDLFQKTLKRTEEEALKLVHKNWDKFGGEECNKGFCDIFAKELQKELPGSKIMSTEEPGNNTLGHVWVEYKDKYFDAETPKGVDDWKELPWVRKFKLEKGGYPKKVDYLTETIDPSEAYTDEDAFRALIDKKRNIMFSAWYVKPSYIEEISKYDDLEIIKVPSSKHNGMIVYRKGNEKNAQELLRLAEKYNGYLPACNPCTEKDLKHYNVNNIEELQRDIHKIGQLLEYDEDKIMHSPNKKITSNENKDPFGLKQYARELAQGLEEALILEGRYDSITRTLVKDTLAQWKYDFEKGEPESELEEEYSLEDSKGELISFEYKASLVFEETEDQNYIVDGGAEEGTETQKGLIEIQFTVDPRNLPKYWEIIYQDLGDVIRHEIEHLTQAGHNVKTGKELPDDRALRNLIEKYKILPEKNYYLLDKEVPAMLQGLYYKAKKVKRPFREVVLEYLGRVGLEQEEIEEILNRWKKVLKSLSLPAL